MIKRKNKIESKYIHGILYYAYKFDNSNIRKTIIKIALAYDGDEYYSSLLRKIFAHYHGIEIGLYSYGCFNSTNFPRGTRIGRYCSFARNVALTLGNHPVKFKSLHPFFFNPALGVVNELKIIRPQYTIGHDVWIGTNALVLPGACKIGTGAIIGAGSVVTHDVPPFAIVAGNPAKIIKYRFSEKTINNIIENQWWEKDIDEIVKDQNTFNLFKKNLE